MFTRILVPTDFSAPSGAALGYARVLADRFGASLHVLHVFESPLVAAATSAEVFVGQSPGIEAELLANAEKRLNECVTPNERTRYAATTDIVMGKPARTIVDYATRGGMDLIVMGTHGRSGAAHLFMGSVAEQVVRAAPCAVLTVHRPSAEETPIPEPLIREGVRAGG